MSVQGSAFPPLLEPLFERAMQLWRELVAFALMLPEVFVVLFYPEDRSLADPYGGCEKIACADFCQPEAAQHHPGKYHSSGRSRPSASGSPAFRPMRYRWVSPLSSEWQSRPHTLSLYRHSTVFAQCTQRVLSSLTVDCSTFCSDVAECLRRRERRASNDLTSGQVGRNTN